MSPLPIERGLPWLSLIVRSTVLGNRERATSDGAAAAETGEMITSRASRRIGSKRCTIKRQRCSGKFADATDISTLEIKRTPTAILCTALPLPVVTHQVAGVNPCTLACLLLYSPKQSHNRPGSAPLSGP